MGPFPQSGREAGKWTVQWTAGRQRAGRDDPRARHARNSWGTGGVSTTDGRGARTRRRAMARRAGSRGPAAPCARARARARAHAPLPAPARGAHEPGPVCFLAPRAAGVCCSRDPRPSSPSPSAGAWDARARDPGAVRLPEETGGSGALHQVLATGPPSPPPPPPGAAGHDGSVVPGAESARGGGGARTTIPTRPRARVPPHSAPFLSSAPVTRRREGRALTRGFETHQGGGKSPILGALWEISRVKRLRRRGTRHPLQSLPESSLLLPRGTREPVPRDQDAVWFQFCSGAPADSGLTFPSLQ